jgi:hypothetical protein
MIRTVSATKNEAELERKYLARVRDSLSGMPNLKDKNICHKE